MGEASGLQVGAGRGERAPTYMKCLRTCGEALWCALTQYINSLSMRKLTRIGHDGTSDRGAEREMREELVLGKVWSM